MSNFDAHFFRDLLREERAECLTVPEVDPILQEAFADACHAFKEARLARDADTTSGEKDRAATAATTTTANSASASASASTSTPTSTSAVPIMTPAMEECMERCVETATPILDSMRLKELDIEVSLLRTAVLARGGAKSLSKFANQSDLNGQLIETLLNNKKIMRDMLLNGGPSGRKYGNAMKLYTQIMAGVEKDRFHKVNKKLAMAAALEFAAPQTEFDTSVEIDAQKRFQHYATAHKKGELDPSFSHFSTWEYRMAINSDATNEQLQWGRDMQTTYAPHIATVYNERWRYNYMVTTDVGYRPPNWTSSPRTYQQLLSGGGMEGPRAWFGRFICRAFGIPVWGFKQPPKNVGMSRWTPKGWVVNFESPPKSVIDTCHSDGRPGADFLEEAKARSAVSETTYYEKVVLLECLGDVCKEKMTRDDVLKTVDPNRLWRSLALVQRRILAGKIKEKSFERTGPSVVVSKIDKYIESIDEDAPPLPIEVDEETGAITIPAASFNKSSGIKHVRKHESFGGGTQLHLVNGEGHVTYEIPFAIAGTFEDDTEYTLSARVSTVHRVQQPLRVETDSDTFELRIPYTIGVWKDTEAIPIDVHGLSELKFYRKKAADCFGLAIKSFTIAPC
eukprot:jgi/Psemu1/14335/gm1.14335_g